MMRVNYRSIVRQCFQAEQYQNYVQFCRTTLIKQQLMIKPTPSHMNGSQSVQVLPLATKKPPTFKQVIKQPESYHEPSSFDQSTNEVISLVSPCEPTANKLATPNMQTTLNNLTGLQVIKIYTDKVFFRELINNKQEYPRQIQHLLWRITHIVGQIIMLVQNNLIEEQMLEPQMVLTVKDISQVAFKIVQIDLKGQSEQEQEEQNWNREELAQVKACLFEVFKDGCCSKEKALHLTSFANNLCIQPVQFEIQVEPIQWAPPQPDTVDTAMQTDRIVQPKPAKSTVIVPPAPVQPNYFMANQGSHFMPPKTTNFMPPKTSNFVPPRASNFMPPPAPKGRMQVSQVSPYTPTPQQQQSRPTTNYGWEGGFSNYPPPPLPPLQVSLHQHVNNNNSINHNKSQTWTPYVDFKPANQGPPIIENMTGKAAKATNKKPTTNTKTQQNKMNMVQYNNMHTIGTTTNKRGRPLKNKANPPPKSLYPTNEDIYFGDVVSDIFKSPFKEQPPRPLPPHPPLPLLYPNNKDTSTNINKTPPLHKKGPPPQRNEAGQFVSLTKNQPNKNKSPTIPKYNPALDASMAASLSASRLAPSPQYKLPAFKPQKPTKAPPQPSEQVKSEMPSPKVNSQTIQEPMTDENSKSKRVESSGDRSPSKAIEVEADQSSLKYQTQNVQLRKDIVASPTSIPPVTVPVIAPSPAQTSDKTADRSGSAGMLRFKWSQEQQNLLVDTYINSGNQLQCAKVLTQSFGESACWSMNSIKEKLQNIIRKVYEKFRNLKTTNKAMLEFKDNWEFISSKCSPKVTIKIYQSIVSIYKALRNLSKEKRQIISKKIIEINEICRQQKLIHN